MDSDPFEPVVQSFQEQMRAHMARVRAQADDAARRLQEHQQEMTLLALGRVAEKEQPATAPPPSPG